MRYQLFKCDRCSRPAMSAFDLQGERHLVFESIAADDPTLFPFERTHAANGTMVRAAKCGTWCRVREEAAS